MASLKQLKDRIVSVKSTKKITQAMKVVAAAKLKRSRKAFESNKEYIEQMNILSHNIFNNIADRDLFPLIFGGEKSSSNKTLIIVFGSDKGLCGAFNSGLVKYLKARLSEISGNKKIICIGKKVYDILKYHSSVEVELFNQDSNLSVDQVKELTRSLIEKFYSAEISSCVVFYNQFISSMTQKNSYKRLVPLFQSEEEFVREKNIESTSNTKKVADNVIFENEPKIEDMANQLAEQCITANIFSMMLESAAGEQGARMSAMDNANRNAEEMIKKITTLYNRTRQSEVTNELIEIISGMEAISKN